MSGLEAHYRKALQNYNPGGTTRDLTTQATILAQGGPGQQVAEGLLPRTQGQFLAGFGPSYPATPSPIDVLNGSIVVPRRDQYPVGYNLPTMPGQGKLVDFGTLRQLAKLYDIARRCIEVRKQEIAQMRWEIVPKDEKKEPDDQVSEITTFFECPDPIRGLEWDDWVKMLIEEVLVVDALSVYPHPSWAPGKGAAGSDLFALEILDGTTIKPLIDVRGARPLAPSPAYQQYLYGIPRSEMAADNRVAPGSGPITDEETLALVQRFSTAVGAELAEVPQLYYRPYHPFTTTLYGFSALEQIILNVNLALKRQQWWISYFSDGSVPAGIITAPDDWEASDLREFEEDWNSRAQADMAWKHRIRVAPGPFTPLKPPIGGDASLMALDEWLAKVTCIGFDVTPPEIGLDPKSGLGGTGWSEQQENVLYRKSLRPLTSWIERLINRVLATWFRREDLNFRFIFEEIEDGLKRAQQQQIELDTGTKTRNEVRAEIGLDPSDDDNANKLVLTTRQGPVLLEDVDAVSKSAAGLNRDGSPKPQPVAPMLPGGQPGAGSNPEQDPLANPEGSAPEDEQRQQRQKAVFEDLRRWETKSVKALKAGKAALVRFDSEAIPSSLADAIRAGLKTAGTVADVKKAFGDSALRAVALGRLEDYVDGELAARAS